MDFISKLKLGLKKTSNKIFTGLSDVLSKRKLDSQSAEELEDLLISADIGFETSTYLVQELVSKFSFNKDVDLDEVKRILAQLICKIIEPLELQSLTFTSKPSVLIICGVNGNGKTTSIAKLANYYKNQGIKITLAACDTFRAAAVSQLAVWSKRLNIELVKGNDNADPASIAYQAVKTSQNNHSDLLLIDTAGRLHNKDHLMAELSKIIKVVNNIDHNLETEIVLVLDGTTGQNMINQIENFQKLSKINYLIITKLDGSAKAGAIVAIARKCRIPILAIGIGESIDDLRPFSAQSFAEALVGI